ncbi:RhoA GTPase effector DIA like protein [Klebsormidium nitens]|uniref:Formin-like protein n=1 Tax=Klebsormidium nitens TaxID=105231 RepID=A0A0U9HK49_KLENI|nr:RhoA GTPase effector DIA like protein [Klebsormidium nitens]|eukprot:GAQ82011.1 RhoA GTPase effector DIA like protein [Klebsormidium nitens]
MKIQEPPSTLASTGRKAGKQASWVIGNWTTLPEGGYRKKAQLWSPAWDGVIDLKRPTAPAVCMGAGGSHLSPAGQAAAAPPAGGQGAASSRRTLQDGPRKLARPLISRGPRGAGGLLSSLWGGFAPEAAAPPAASDTEPRELAADSRVWAFTYEDAGGGPDEDRKYLVCLTSAAARLEAVAPLGTLLLVNVGSLLLQPGLYSLFHNNVCELGAHWDVPRGAAVAPLDLLFAACASMQNWLAIDDDHLAVLHTRGAQDLGAGSFLRFVAACYLTFSEEFDFTVEALQELPVAPLRSGPAWASHRRGSPSEGAFGTATAAQRRYCQYFDMLHNKTMPARRMGALHLRQVILSAAPGVDGQGGCRPYVKVFWRGQEVKTSAPDRQVPAKHTAASGWQVPFELGVEVQGDVAITVHHYTGDIWADDQLPLLVYAFHTAFTEAGLVRVPRAQLDSAYGGALEVPPDFFLDMILEPSAAAVHARAGVGRVSQDGDLDTDGPDWKDLLLAGTQHDAPAHTAAQEKGRRQQAVMRNVMSEMKAGFASGGTSALLRRTPERSPSKADADTPTSTAPDAPPGTEAGHPADASGSAGAGRLEPADIPKFVPPPPAAAPPSPLYVASSPTSAATRRPPPPPRTIRSTAACAPSPTSAPSSGPSLRLAAPAAPSPTAQGSRAPASAPPPWRAPSACAPWRPTPSWEGQGDSEAALGGPAGVRALEFLFRNKAKRGTAGAAAEAVGKRGRRESVVKLITVTRANNVAIMLTQFKMPAGAVRECILRGAEPSGPGAALSLEKLGLLLQVIPTEDEVALLTRYEGPPSELSAPEQFLATMAQVPRLRNKIQVLIFTRQFGGLVADTAVALRTVRRACAQVRESHLLRRVLAAVLAAGNHLNSGSARGGAAGCTLASLAKLADMKATPPGKDEAPVGAVGPAARASSLLEFVAAAVAAGGASSQGGPTELAVELGAVGEAARWTNAALLEALAAVDRGLAAIADECAACAPRAPPAAGEGSAAADPPSEKGSAGAEEADGAEGGASEAGFARQLRTFLAGAEVQRGELVALADACRADFQALATYLGEPPATAAPEEVLGMLWAFAVQFDKAARELHPPPHK